MPASPWAAAAAATTGTAVLVAEPELESASSSTSSWVAAAAAAPPTELDQVPLSEPPATNGHSEPEPEPEPDPDQRQAVEAYCQEYCEPESASAAVGEALAAARPGTSAAEMLALTRMAAAQHPPHGLEGACADTPRLLAARDNGELTKRKARQLDSHLAACVICQSTELRAARSERMYLALDGAAAVATQAEADENPTTVWDSGAWEAAAATAGAGAGAGTAAAAAGAATIAAPEPHRTRRRSPVLAVGLGVLVVAAIAAVAIVLANRSSTRPVTPLPSAASPASTTINPTAPKATHGAGAAAARHHHKAKPATKHHRATKKHKHPAHKSSGGSTATAATPAAATSVPAAPVTATPTPTPTRTPTPTPTPTPPPSSPTLVQSGSGNLGAASAPTSGIGSGKH